MKDKARITKTELLMLIFVAVTSIFIIAQVQAASNNKPAVIEPTENVYSNTVNMPNTGVSNPAGHLPPGRNK